MDDIGLAAGREKTVRYIVKNGSVGGKNAYVLGEKTVRFSGGAGTLLSPCAQRAVIGNSISNPLRSWGRECRRSVRRLLRFLA
jgi:hypothetical protein